MLKGITFVLTCSALIGEVCKAPEAILRLEFWITSRDSTLLLLAGTLDHNQGLEKSRLPELPH